MIVEALILGVTTVTCASLWFADRVLKREHQDTSPDTAHADAKAILERQRCDWVKAANEAILPSGRYDAMLKVQEIDERLLKLGR